MLASSVQPKKQLILIFHTSPQHNFDRLVCFLLPNLRRRAFIRFVLTSFHYSTSLYCSVMSIQNGNERCKDAGCYQQQNARVHKNMCSDWLSFLMNAKNTSLFISYYIFFLFNSIRAEQEHNTCKGKTPSKRNKFVVNHEIKHIFVIIWRNIWKIVRFAPA